ncbi:hypothetical protein [Streptomyces longispororuber]|uniref:hypothetical protein n=1 Tax=Streptomyces longispororuber TaxID=68230 RepID=UPI0036FE2800
MTRNFGDRVQEALDAHGVSAYVHYGAGKTVIRLDDEPAWRLALLLEGRLPQEPFESAESSVLNFPS